MSQGNFLVVNTLKCISMNNQKCKVRPEIININSDEPSFVKISKCNGSCNNIIDPYTKLCVPDVSKNMNVKYLTKCQEITKQDT